MSEPEFCDRHVPRVFTAGNYLRQMKPIESVIDQLPVPRGGLISVTGKTGHGKTTLFAAIETAFVRGERFAGREVTRGSVLVLAGENPEDWGMHLMATLQDQGLTREDLFDHETRTALLVVPGVFNVAFGLEYLREKIEEVCSPLVAVIVDTSAAFFSGDQENDNAAMRSHASSLRELSTLPGRPAVMVLCHPVKNPAKDNLLPRGGGAFLAEVDANLTVWKDEADVITLHWQGKIRGANFDPIRFELRSVELEGIRDCRDRPILSSVIRHVPDERAEAIEAKALDDENRLLLAMLRKPGGSISDLAMKGGFTTGPGTPHKSKVSRLLNKLDAQRLVKKSRIGTWELTRDGKKAAEELL